MLNAHKYASLSLRLLYARHLFFIAYTLNKKKEGKKKKKYTLIKFIIVVVVKSNNSKYMFIKDRLHANCFV